MTTPDPVRAQCELCGTSSVIVFNGFGFCLDHVGEGFGRTIRLIAVVRGAPVEVVERLAAEAMRDLANQYGKDI